VFSWAPSARFLYATLMTSGAANAWRLRMDDGLRVTALDRLTTGPGADWAPRVSRDGKSLLFSTITGDSRLWSFPLDPVAGKAPVTGDPLSEEDGGVNWASLSADGLRLAYFYRPLNSALQQSELRLFSAPFREPSETVSADRYVRMASAWSRSGDRLALQAAELSSSGTPLNNVVLIRGRDGSEQVIARCQAAEGQTCTIAPMDWTPDDTAILTASRLGGERTTKLSVWPVSVAIPSETPRATLVSDSQWSVTSARYSPDGRWVAFAYGTAFRDEKGIAVAPASGQVERAAWRSIAEGFEEIGNPQWSADGRFVYFTSSHTDRWLNVWRVQIASSTGSQIGSPSKVTAFDSARFFLLSRTYYPTIAVGPDRLVLPMNSQQSAVWMLDNVDR
jgi:Tol biopolymer transport system component